MQASVGSCKNYASAHKDISEKKKGMLIDYLPFPLSLSNTPHTHYRLVASVRARAEAIPAERREAYAEIGTTVLTLAAVCGSSSAGRLPL